MWGRSGWARAFLSGRPVHDDLRVCAAHVAAHTSSGNARTHARDARPWVTMMRALLVAIGVLLGGVHAAGAQTPSPTITPVAGQDCCLSHAAPGCDESACETCVCVGDGTHNDPGCCGIQGQFPNKWDWQCSLEAKGFYTVLVSCAAECSCSVAYQTVTPTPVTPPPTPTVTPTRTVTPVPSGVATVTPNPFLCCDCDTADCVPPVHNVCPTPCVAVPNAVCP